jgi:hypothetical protein
MLAFISRVTKTVSSSIAALALGGALVYAVVPASAAQSAASAAVADAGGMTDCGTIALAPAGAPDAIAAAANCFQKAYASCHNAQLVANWNTDTERLQRYLVVTPSDSGCMVVDSVTRTPVGAAVDSSDTYQCRNVVIDAKGVKIQGCGADGDIDLK